jgi:hypothetical protein
VQCTRFGRLGASARYAVLSLGAWAPSAECDPVILAPRSLRADVYGLISGAYPPPRPAAHSFWAPRSLRRVQCTPTGRLGASAERNAHRLGA